MLDDCDLLYCFHITMLFVFFFFQIINCFYIQAEVIVDCSVVRSGRNLTVVAMEFKLKKTGQLAYTARTTFYNTPVAKL